MIIHNLYLSDTVWSMAQRGVVSGLHAKISYQDARRYDPLWGPGISTSRMACSLEQVQWMTACFTSFDNSHLYSPKNSPYYFRHKFYKFSLTSIQMGRHFRLISLYVSCQNYISVLCIEKRIISFLYFLLLCCCYH